MNEDFKLIKKKFDEQKSWGLATSFDLKCCNPNYIRDANRIKEFVAQLVQLIDMKSYGDCTVINFGEDEKVAGFSMIQFIETSLLSAHFRNQDNSIYLDVFSCKLYDPNIVKNFAMKFFDATSCRVIINYRV